MNSCDNILFPSYFKYISTTDLIVSCGIACYIHEFEYAGKIFCFPNGRGVAVYTDLLNDLGILYNELNYTDLMKFKDECDKIFVLCPKAFMDKPKNINKEIVQISTSYSMYKVIKISESELHLSLFESKPFVLCYEDIERLSTISKVKPWGFSLRFVYVNKTQERITKPAILANMKSNLKKSIQADTCFSFEHKDLLTFAGDGFYAKFIDIINNYDNMHPLQQSLFKSTFSIGSSYFFRKEFAQALSEYGVVPDWVVNSLSQAGDNWRSIGRILNLQKSINVIEIEKLIRTIMNLEKPAFDFLCNI